MRSGFRTQLKKLGQTQVARQSVGILALLFLGTLTITVHGAALVALLASSASTVNDATTTLFFTPRGESSLTVGSTAEVDINISTKVPINAIGATIAFPSDTVEVVGISKKDSFIDLWTEDTTIKEDAGEVHFSGGTTRKEGLLGSGTALTLTLKAKKAASAELIFKDVQVFPHDGKGRPVQTTSRPLAYKIIEESSGAGGGAAASAGDTRFSPDPDFDGSGRVTLVDLSILTFRILAPYNPRFDLNVDGSLGIADISVLLTHLSR